MAPPKCSYTKVLTQSFPGNRRFVGRILMARSHNRNDGVLSVRRSSRAGILACVLALALASCGRGAEELAYSDLKGRIAAGEVAEVRISATGILAVPTDAARTTGAPDNGWRATTVPEDPDLLPLLDRHGVTYTGVQVGAVHPGALLVVLGIGALLVAAIVVLQRRGERGAGRVGELAVRDAADGRLDVTFDQVAGVDEAKDELRDVVEFLKEPGRFGYLGARVPRGVLLVGPPGTGKTLLARAVAGEAGVPFFSISGSDFVEVYVGVGASRVRKLFQRARAKAPSIVFIDELDAAGKARGAAAAAGNDEREQTLNQLLVEMDGFSAETGIVVLAATNRPEILDAALLRPGRFDRQVTVDRPDRDGREAILRVHAANIRLDPDVDLAAVARRTPGFVGADLANLLNEAALLAARVGLPAVDGERIDLALDRITTGLEKKNRVLSAAEREIVAYHEAGHAIVAETSPTAEPVARVSIIPRGSGALGFMQQIPEERYLLQEDELRDRLAVLLAGRAAEELTFGKVSTGASNDLERATELARRMVCEFGMSRVIGPMAYAGRGAQYLPEQRNPAGPASADGRIDDEVRGLLAGAYDRARDVLERRRVALTAVAERLLDREVIDRDELVELLAVAEPEVASA